MLNVKIKYNFYFTHSIFGNLFLEIWEIFWSKNKITTYKCRFFCFFVLLFLLRQVFFCNMDQIGRVDTNNTRCDSFSGLINHLATNGIFPTHYLVLKFAYGEKVEGKHMQTRIRQVVSHYIHDTRHSVRLGRNEEDIVFIRWKRIKRSSDCVFCTTTRFADNYVHL